MLTDTPLTDNPTRLLYVQENAVQPHGAREQLLRL
jgi:hypothetical protein